MRQTMHTVLKAQTELRTHQGDGFVDDLGAAGASKGCSK
jgi:hypothetical protein